MTLRARFARFEGFATDWRRLLGRGIVMMVLGAVLAAASLFNPEAMLMHAREFSWLPAAAFLVVAAGAVECFDAFMAKEPTGFFIHLPVGVLDLVTGSLIILSIGGTPEGLRLMIAAFLLVKGILRITLAQVTQLPHNRSTTYGGIVSVILGLLLWLQWPSSGGWFLALGLSTDIALRGWAIIMFALWLRGSETPNTAT